MTGRGVAAVVALSFTTGLVSAAGMTAMAFGSRVSHLNSSRVMSGERPYAGRALQQLEGEVVVYLNEHGVPAVAWPARYGRVSRLACDGPGVCNPAVAVFSIPGGIVVDPSLRALFTGCYRMRGRSAARREALGYSCDVPAHVLVHETLHGVNAEENGEPILDEGLVDAVAADLAPGLAREWSGQASGDDELGYPVLVDGVRARSQDACHEPWRSACAVALRRSWLVGWRPPSPVAGS